MKKYYCVAGTKFGLPSNYLYFQEIAYALADKGYILRVSPTSGLPREMIKGATKFAKNRKVPLSDVIEIYIHKNKAGEFFDDQAYTHDVTKLPNYEKALEIVKHHSKQDLEDYPIEKKILSCTPYLCLGRELKHPPVIFITDEKLLHFNSEGDIIDSFATSSQIIKTLKTYSPETQIFSYDLPEHKQRMNKLVYHVKQ